ncbi:uncharacterized protein [Temnothorax nylanderi]|uniref:uncharacterized protein n=1 Tax=Temnothorax nylanderi TaxID=102681 RepID=UPI003A8BE7ED
MRKEGKKTLSIWDYFTIIDEMRMMCDRCDDTSSIPPMRVMCDLCGETLSIPIIRNTRLETIHDLHNQAKCKKTSSSSSSDSNDTDNDTDIDTTIKQMKRQEDSEASGTSEEKMLHKCIFIMRMMCDRCDDTSSIPPMRVMCDLCGETLSIPIIRNTRLETIHDGPGD